MKFILVLLILAFSVAAYSSPTVEGTEPEGACEAAEKAGKELAKKIREECFARRGGNTAENQRKCQQERNSYGTYIDQCIDHMRAETGAIDITKCKYEATMKSHNIK